jgi:hypothetical protein
MKHSRIASLSLASLVFAACGSQKSQFAPIPAKNGNSQQTSPTPVVSPELKTMKNMLPSLGHGVSLTSGSVVGECITGTAPDANILAQGTATGEFSPDAQTVSADMVEVESREQLRKTLSLSANGKASWGAASVSASTSLFERLEVTQHTLNLLMRVKVTNPEVRMHDVRLTPEAAELLRSRGADAFFRRCGTEAVIGFQTGGEYLAYVTVTSAQRKTANEIKAELSGKGVNFSGGAQFAQTIDKITSDYNTTITIERSGGKGEKLFFTPAELKEAMAVFPSVVLKNAVPYRQVTVPFSTLIEGIDTLSQQKRRSQTEDVANMFDEVHNQIADLRFILKNDRTLVENDIAVIKNDIKSLEKDLSALQLTIATCENPENICQIPEDLSNTQSVYRNRTEVSAHESCGVATFNFGTKSSVCGFVPETTSVAVDITEMVTVTDARCGVKAYNTRLDRLCGCRNPAGMAVGDSCQRKSCSRPEFGVAEYHSCQVSQVRTEMQAHTAMKEASCRHPEFGVESYKVCRHAITIK